MTKRAWLCAAVALVGLSGCRTVFVGQPKVQGGRQTCEATCKQQGMELAGMVFMGEYSDGCICQVPGKKVTAADVASSVGPPVAGVMMQMEDDEAQQNASRGGSVPGRGW